MNRDADWLRWRKGGLGASDVAAAWTRSYGQTPYSVVAKKLGLMTDEIDDETQALFDHGHDMEPLIGLAVHDLLGLHVAGEQSWIEHTTEPWMRATVDGFLLHKPDDMLNAAAGVFEAKTSQEHARLNWPYYIAQVQWQMLVTGLPLAVVAVLKTLEDGRTLYVREFAADKAFQRELTDFARELWGHVQAATLPPAETVEDVKALYPTTVHPDAVEVPPDLVGALRHAEAVAAEGDRQLKAVKAELAELLEDHETAVCSGDVVATWKNQDATRLDQKALKAAHPDLVEGYMTTTTSRVLRLKL
jgi:putative phage-type endonuclease